MLATALIRLHRTLLLVALSVALIGTGFAHRMPDLQDRANTEALAFALANGVSQAEFCGGDPQGGSGQGWSCLACQIVGTADLPAMQASVTRADLALVVRRLAPRESRALQRVLDPAHTPQGPPVA